LPPHPLPNFISDANPLNHRVYQDYNKYDDTGDTRVCIYSAKDALGMEIGADHLYLKHDELSGSLYGGNKIRNLLATLALSPTKLE
jgi:hypothetical protein